MKKRITFFRSMISAAVVSLLLLLIPFIAMQCTTEVNWRAADFLIMGMLLLGTLTAFIWLYRNTTSILFTVASAAAVGCTFVMIWANLAVGLIGAGPHAGNLMFTGIVLLVVIGAIRSGFTAAGLEQTMYAAALGVLVIMVIALLSSMDQYPGSSAKEIIGVCSAFAAGYTIAGSLFHIAGKRRPVKSI